MHRQLLFRPGRAIIAGMPADQVTAIAADPTAEHSFDAGSEQSAIGSGDGG